MSLLGRLARPFRSYRLLRAGLAELRGLRLATERLAEAQEQANRQAGGPAVAGQAFRSPHPEARQAEDRDQSAVAYVDNEATARALAVERDLRGILGRDPSDEELCAALDEDGER